MSLVTQTGATDAQPLQPHSHNPSRLPKSRIYHPALTPSPDQDVSHMIPAGSGHEVPTLPPNQPAQGSKPSCQKATILGVASVSVQFTPRHLGHHPPPFLHLALWLLGTCYILSAPTEGVPRLLCRAATLDLALPTGPTLDPMVLPGLEVCHVSTLYFFTHRRIVWFV